MSEVKWVNEWYSRQDQVPVQRIPGGALETVAVPILTLDDIEVWLTQCIEDGYVNIAQCIDDVRAMRGQGCIKQ